MSKKSFYILFDKTSKIFTGIIEAEFFSKDSLGSGILFKKVSYDPEAEFWMGDYDNGNIYSLSDRSVITQQELRNEVSSRIFSEYDLITQINIMLEQVNLLALDNKTPEFESMYNRIQEFRTSYRVQKQAYIDNPEAYIWISDQEIIEKNMKYVESISR